MSTKVQSGEAVVVAAGDSKQEVVWTACACCGLTEECTPAYVARVRERFDGRWVCGLCGEAVMDEILRSGRRTSTAEALRRHRAFCESFRTVAPPPIDTAEHLIAAVRQLLRRSLDSPRAVRSTPNSPLRPAVAGTPAAVSDEGIDLFFMIDKGVTEVISTEIDLGVGKKLDGGGTQWRHQS